MSTANVNHYCIDRDFSPFFVMLGSYFSFTGQVCVNGREYLKPQLDREAPRSESGTLFANCTDYAER